MKKQIKLYNILFRNNKSNYLKHKEEDSKFISERVNYYNNIYGFDFNRISVRNQRTRWGSCSSKKNLNFNYRLLFLSKRISDYIIVHELCHLKELNHSRKFWNLVAEVIPDYLDIRRDLRNKRFRLSRRSIGLGDNHT